jgi:hypothetical protein
MRSTRCLLGRDHPEPGLRGAHQRSVRSASSLFGLLSTHPKQSASSTAASYSMRGFPVDFLYETSQTPVAWAWFAMSHSRHSSRLKGCVEGCGGSDMGEVVAKGCAV